MSGLAPTQLAVAGGAAGWVAGGVGAAAYALYCDEMAALFIAFGYVLGMRLPALVEHSSTTSRCAGNRRLS